MNLLGVISQWIWVQISREKRWKQLQGSNNLPAECFPLAFIRNFCLKYSLFWILVQINGHITEKMCSFFKDHRCLNKFVGLMLFCLEKELVTKIKFINIYFIYFWYAPKRHTNCKNRKKSQIGFPKFKQILVKSDERQGKTKNSCGKMCLQWPISILGLYCPYSRKYFLSIACWHIYMPASWSNHVEMF